MRRLNIPGTQQNIPGTRNPANPHQHTHIPCIPGIPGLRPPACVHANVSRTRTSQSFPARVYMEYPEYPEYSLNGKAFRDSGYPEYKNHTRNILPMAKPMRQTMPICAGFIDACREVFGTEQINAAIKSGIAGQETFYASENGAILGVFTPDRGIPLSDMLVGPVNAATPAAGARK